MPQESCNKPPTSTNGNKTIISEGTKVTLKVVAQILSLAIAAGLLIWKNESSKDQIVLAIEKNRTAIQENRVALGNVWTYQAQVLWTERFRRQNPSNSVPDAKDILQTLDRMERTKQN